MPNTYQVLINWDKGQPFAERMSAKLMGIENFEEIDPQSPMGGPDGTKDIVSSKGGRKYIIGCYYPNGQKDFKDIQDKFKDDLKGVAKNNAQGFVFVTNQKITPGERVTLSQGSTYDVHIYHGERVCGILDSPKGYGVRLEYLGVELSKAEQISFLSSHLDLKQDFKEIKNALAALNKVTNRLAGEIHLRDNTDNKLSVLPIAGVKFSSRISIEDLLIMHRIIMQETQQGEYYNLLGFRNVEVWVGKPGVDKSQADFVAPAPAEVSSSIIELLSWWRDEYMKVLYTTEDKKVSAMANFHMRFLRIHPFLDGNGRVARALASIQFKDLLDKDVKFDAMERSEYYIALRNADSGNSKELNDIFTALIKE